MLILNLFVAMLLSATEEIGKVEENAVNRYQIDKIKDIWFEFDPNGEGVINYKELWRLTLKVAIILGINRKDLLDIETRKNFSRMLAIPVYEHKKSKVFCHKFHDVIISLAKMSVAIKYGCVGLKNLFLLLKFNLCLF